MYNITVCLTLYNNIFYHRILTFNNLITENALFHQTDSAVKFTSWSVEYLRVLLRITTMIRSTTKF